MDYDESGHEQIPPELAKTNAMRVELNAALRATRCALQTLKSYGAKPEHVQMVAVAAFGLERVAAEL